MDRKKRNLSMFAAPPAPRARRRESAPWTVTEISKEQNVSRQRQLAPGLGYAYRDSFCSLFISL